jgi:hypothetical protein
MSELRPHITPRLKESEWTWLDSILTAFTFIMFVGGAWIANNLPLIEKAFKN